MTSRSSGGPPPPFDALSRKLRESEAFRRLAAGARRAEGLPTAAAAWVAELLKQDLGRPLLVVVPRESDALAWVEAVELFGGEGVRFAAPSLSPYQETEVSLAVRAEEVVALRRLTAARTPTIVSTPRSLFRRLPTAERLAEAVVVLEPETERPLEELVAHLASWGYRRTDLVTEVGEMAVRGGVFDLWSPGEEAPVRVDLFGDTIESVRLFDPADQRSLERVDRFEALPPALFPHDELAAMRLADELELLLLDEGLGMEASERLEDLRERGSFPGWENYLPLLEETTVSLRDLRPDTAVVVFDPDAVEAEIERHAARLREDHAARVEHQHLAVEPELLELPPEAVADAVVAPDLAVGPLFAAGGFSAEDADTVVFRGSQTDLFHGQLPRFPRELETARARGERMLLVGGAEHWGRLEEFCRHHSMELGHGGVEIVAGDLRRGFRLPAAGVSVYGEQQLFPRPEFARRRPGRRLSPFVSGLRDLKPGDYVVHEDHGIGRYVGLRSVAMEAARVDLPPVLAEARGEVSAETPSEVMEIAYKDGRRLLLPLHRVDQIQKYGGIEGMAPALDRLGGTSWGRTKAKVRRGLRQLAGDLLKLYAERQLARAPAMPPDGELQRLFEEEFEYVETPDQLEASGAIKQDLEQERPMDRLLCGDVGFGKTEVAMRAAHKVVEGGHQVVVLAPTTILADQHLETFRRRFEGFPVRVEMVSRFRTAKEVREVFEGLASGKVDIVIGTHRVLSKKLSVPRLGLVIIDEEQRFGVAQKERFKELKKNVHVLAMSATPVPRTLQLSLAGVRDLSVIETAPRDRMAVETAILPYTAEGVREAIEFELERGGQIFYVYNRVEMIEGMARVLRELVPDLRLTVAHGQLPEHELEKRMHAFRERQHDVLLASTIIENGIDLPNVNTMIVHRADRFGLAQLYQLRGRVGRSETLGYCYLLVPADRALSEHGRKRLAAIREFTELGAGFRIAARDLEIRGAGNLLGAEQSGHIVAVGIETYLKMLEDAVRELKGEAVEEDGPSVAIDLPVSMAIPADYVADANLRMEIYRKAASGEHGHDDLLSELRDRFGPPPPAVEELLEVAGLKRLSERLRVQSISAKGRQLRLRLRQDARIRVERLIEMVAAAEGLAFTPSGVLTLEEVAPADRVRRAIELLEELAQEASP